MIEYEETPEFKKDLKNLKKRFRSLYEDIETAKIAVIELNHIKNINNLSTFEIQGYKTEQASVWKIKKFACKALKGKGVQSGIRIIYMLNASNSKVTFIEIYFKGDKENENADRIKKAIR